MSEELVFSPREFVAVVNQVLDTAMPTVVIVGEISNFRISRGQWVYFDIKDEDASVKCFATVYTLTMPIEDGMIVRISAAPRLHPQYNFSLTVANVLPMGEGSIKKSIDLLAAKLDAEGLFDHSRKRILPFAPERVALITSKEAAAYGDFMKVAKERWGLASIDHFEVPVQGEPAAAAIITALERVNTATELFDLVVITRGGGNADDLLAFQDEVLIRAIAASSTPTVVAVGHERDVTLAEMAADVRASTPSNAAELVFPSRFHEQDWLKLTTRQLAESLGSYVENELRSLENYQQRITHRIEQIFQNEAVELAIQKAFVQTRDPRSVLRQGYAIVRDDDYVAIRSVKQLISGKIVHIIVHDGTKKARIQ